MELKHIKGNTWVIVANELIPLYLLGDGRCVMLDSGLAREREELESTLQQAGLSLAGILCTHAHVDHCANNDYFQKKYHIPVALTAPEAGMCSSILNLKCYRLLVTPGVAEQEMSEMVHTPDVIIPYEDGTLTMAGAEFGIVTTPGHSSGHICIITPDNVCYAGDAIMSREMLEAKLPYSLAIQAAMESRKKLATLDCDVFVMAHKGTIPGCEIEELVEENHQLIFRRLEQIKALITEPMHFSRICQLVYRNFGLRSTRARRALYYERNIRFFVEYLLDQDQLDILCRDGVAYYAPKA